jgi:prolipoprotein diacylglyceryl transferase
VRWNVDPVLVRFGDLELRWYGLFFATGLLLSAWKAPKYFEIWGLPKQHAERLTLWVPIGMLLGAHYIHLIFYEWDGLFDLRFEIRRLWPLDVEVGRFWALGSGLASHGGGLGCVLALLLFWSRHARQHGISFWRYADAVMIVSIWVYGWVRLGNFFNSELYGRPTDVPWGVIFERWGFTTPRHPVQLYEAALYFAELAFAVRWFQPRYARKLRPGTTFLLFLTIHFSLRFCAEFFKETQGVDDGWPLNMGHVLSLPIVIVCAGLILFTERFSIRKPLTPEEIAAIEASVARAKEIDAAAQGRAPGNTEPTQAPGAASASGRGSLPRNKKKRRKENAPERREADP